MQPAARHSGTETQREGDQPAQPGRRMKGLGKSVKKCFIFFFSNLTREEGEEG